MSHLIAAKVNGLAGRSKPLHINLHRHVNIIFGLNGSGKTSLLKILHSAMSGDASILENVPFTSAEVSIYSLSYDKTFTRSFSKDKTKPPSSVPDLPAEIESRVE